MTRKEKVQTLLHRITALPDDQQDELVQALVEIRADHLGVYELDDDERAALVRSGEDIRRGRFASDQEIENMFARYRQTS